MHWTPELHPQVKKVQLDPLINIFAIQNTLLVLLEFMKMPPITTKILHAAVFHKGGSAVLDLSKLFRDLQRKHEHN